MKSMKVKRYLQGLLLIICLLVTSCAQIMAVNADEQDVSLEITLEDESTPMEGVIFSMYQIFATLSSDEFKKTAAAKKNLCGCRSNWRLEAKKSPVVPGK